MPVYGEIGYAQPSWAEVVQVLLGWRTSKRLSAEMHGRSTRSRNVEVTG